MFEPVKEFESDGYYYDENADTHVLEYLYSVANNFCPDFDGDFDTNGNPVYLPSQAVFWFRNRYNLARKNKATKRSNNKMFRLQNLKERVDTYIKSKGEKNNWEIQNLLNWFGFDPEKFWYLLLFIYDYCIGKCVANIVFEEDSPIGQVEKLYHAIGSNFYIEKDEKGKSHLKQLQGMSLVLKIGEDNYSITSPQIIQQIARFCLHGVKTLPPKSILSYKATKKESTPERDSVLEQEFISMFSYFFNLGGFGTYKRRKNATLIREEKELIVKLLHFTEININATISSIIKANQRYEKSEFDSINGFYF